MEIKTTKLSNNLYTLEGSGGNEETALDNFRVAAVPLPSTLAFLGLGLMLMGYGRRRAID